MDVHGQLREQLSSAMSGAPTARTAADRLCQACVTLLPVDGAAISVVHEGASRGTFGPSGQLSRLLDEYQFTFGEGPCLDAVRDGRAVLAPDLRDPAEHRWPVFAGAALERGVAAVFALPVALASTAVGALDVFRTDSGALPDRALHGALVAAELAAAPLLEALTVSAGWDPTENGSRELAALERVEVYQATGMMVAAWDVSASEAVVRLRARAFATGRTASEIAWAVVERRLPLHEDGWGREAGDGEEGTAR